MTLVREHFKCDEPGCAATATAETSSEWAKAYKAGWRGYWVDDPEAGGVLCHHCGDHPVETTSTEVKP